MIHSPSSCQILRNLRAHPALQPRQSQGSNRTIRDRWVNVCLVLEVPEWKSLTQSVISVSVNSLPSQ